MCGFTNEQSHNKPSEGCKILSMQNSARGSNTSTTSLDYLHLLNPNDFFEANEHGENVTSL